MILTVGHVAVFGREAVGLLKRMKDDESKGKSTDDMTAWVNMNRIRFLTIDLPAWICFLLGALGSL